MDSAYTIFLVIIVGGGITCWAYLTNRSRCSLEEAAQRSGCSENDVRELIQAGLLEYRRKYVLFGPRSLDASQITEAREALIKIKQIRAETEATLRQQAEAFAAEMQEMQRRAQEREAAHQAYMEMLDRLYAEMLRNMKIQLMPPEVVEAFRVLALSTDTPLKEVYRRYRLLAKQHHPDAGGDAQRFIQINKAYTCIEDWMKSQA
jgi:DnaJ-domain-containing protein 1